LEEALDLSFDRLLLLMMMMMTIMMIVPFRIFYSFLGKDIRPDDDLVKRIETCSNFQTTLCI
jgi:hypothetical protein